MTFKQRVCLYFAIQFIGQMIALWICAASGLQFGTHDFGTVIGMTIFITASMGCMVFVP